MLKMKNIIIHGVKRYNFLEPKLLSLSKKKDLVMKIKIKSEKITIISGLKSKVPSLKMHKQFLQFFKVIWLGELAKKYI